MERFVFGSNFFSKLIHKMKLLMSVFNIPANLSDPELQQRLTVSSGALKRNSSNSCSWVWNGLGFQLSYDQHTNDRLWQCEVLKRTGDGRKHLLLRALTLCVTKKCLYTKAELWTDLWLKIRMLWQINCTLSHILAE